MVCPPLGSAVLGQDGSEGRLETNPVYQKVQIVGETKRS